MSKRSFAPVVLVVVLALAIGAVGGSVGFIDTAAGQDSVLVENDISSDTTWEAGSGPYRIVKSVTVTQDTTLTIEPGVTVELAEDVNLTVNGKLQAVGETETPVVFTSSKADPTPGSWGTIRLAGPYGSLTRIHNAKITYATDGVTLADSQRVSLENVEIADSSRAAIHGSGTTGYAPTGEISIEDSTLHDNQFGIRGYDEKYLVVRTAITDNDAEGIKLTNRLNVLDIQVRDSRLEHNDIGINVQSRPDQHNRGGVVRGISIENTKIRDNLGDGVRLFGDRLLNIRLANNQIAANGGVGVSIQDTGNAGGARATQNISVTNSRVHDNGHIGLEVGASYSTLRGLELRGNDIGENGGTGARISADRTITDLVLADNEVWLNDGDGLAVAGSETDGVRVTSEEVFGNEGNGVAIDGSAVRNTEISSMRSSLNGEAGVMVNGSNEQVGTTVADAVLAANEDGLVIAGHPATIQRTAIEYNNGTGVRFEGVGSTGNVVRTTDIYGNGNGVWVPEEADETVANVTNNYWGAPSGPHHASVNPEGEGDSVNGGLEMVEFLPYAESAFGEVNDRPDAAVEAPEEPIEPGSEATISALQSTDDGEIQWYRFSFNNSTNTGWIRDGEITRTFEHPGTYVVNVTVADDHGVPSTENATAEIVVESPDEASNGDEGTTSDGSGSGSDGETGGNGNSDENDGELDVQVPGFGAPTALVSVLLAVFVLRRVGSQ